MLVLLSEILYPVCEESVPNIDRLTGCVSLLELRNRVFTHRSESQKAVRRSTVICCPDSIHTLSSVSACKEDGTFFVNSRKPRGLTTTLAALLQIKRQSVEKSLKAAGLYEERNAAIATLRMMKRFL